jgi:hypothetical protein
VADTLIRSLREYGRGDQILTSIGTPWLIKSGYEVIATPLTYAVVNFLRRAENLDAYDRDTNFMPFKFETE